MTSMKKQGEYLQGRADSASGPSSREKRPYSKPVILSRDMLESVAAACGNGAKLVPDFFTGDCTQAVQS